jgi:hypothetical protein
MRPQTLLLAVLADASARSPDKALDTLLRMDSRVGGDGDRPPGRQSLRQCHLAGLRLKKILQRLKQEGKADEVQQISIGAQLLLDRIARRDDRDERTPGDVLRPPVGAVAGDFQVGSSFWVQAWVAETCMALGDDGRQTPASPEAAAYLSRAERTWRAMLDRLRSSPSCGPADAASDIQVRLAAGLRAEGEYAQALDRLAGVLGSENLRIDAQIEAARTWQAWGRKEPGCYLRAICVGSYPVRVSGGANRQVSLWGWEEIVRRLASSPGYREPLADARYNLAVCRTRWAAKQAEPSRGALLGKAAEELAALHGQGPVWAARRDSLLKEIDVARKVKVSGN